MLISATPDGVQPGSEYNPTGSGGGGGDAARITVSLAQQIKQDEPHYSLVIDNEEPVVSQERRELAGKITVDLGYLPESYVQAATGAAGRGVSADSSRFGADFNDSPLQFGTMLYANPHFS